MTEQQVIDAAVRKHRTECRAAGATYDQPGDVTYNRRAGTVTLSNVRGTLATYAVATKGSRVRLTLLQ